MKITFTYASQKDFKWLSDAEKGHEITSTMLKRKIQDKEVLLVKADNKLIGWLRFGFFWDEVPFMNMLGLDKEHRGKGIGKKLVRFWEAEMKKKKYKIFCAKINAGRANFSTSLDSLEYMIDHIAIQQI